jgi:hypothetical protein
MKIEVNVTKKYFFGILIAILAIGGLIFAYAYNNPPVGGNPAVMGHSIDEIGTPASCAAGQVLTWSGSAWSCTTVSGPSGGNPTGFYAYKTDLSLPVDWHICYSSDRGVYSNQPTNNGNIYGPTNFIGIHWNSTWNIYVGKDDYTGDCPAGFSFLASDKNTLIDCVGSNYQNGWICNRTLVGIPL